MKIKMLLGLTFISLGTTFAEQISKSENSPFDVLHGQAYNSVGNEAASDNVGSLLARPDLFANQKFFYVEPSDKFGVVSFGNVFAGVEISNEIGQLTFGYARTGFGADIRLALGQFYVKDDNGEKSGTEAGDNWGLSLSMVVKNHAFVLNVDWNTFEEETNVEPEFGYSTEENYRELSSSLAFTNAPLKKIYTWNLGVEFIRHIDNTKLDDEVVTDFGSYYKTAPFFSIGFLGLKSEHARVFAGAKASVPIAIFDDENADSSNVNTLSFESGLALNPNILGEALIGKNVILFGEASYEWLVFNYTKGTFDENNDYTLLESHMNKVTATLGFRYQYEDWIACEFAFGEKVFTDTKSIFNGEGTFISFGGFLYF